MQEPKDIYQEVLDFTSKAFWAGDFVLGCTRLSFPHYLIVNDARSYCEVEDDLIVSAFQMQKSLRNQGATDYFRICMEATYQPDKPHRIIGQHLTHVLRNGTYIIDPYPSKMELVCENGVWKGCGIRTYLDNKVSSIIRPDKITDHSGGAPCQSVEMPE
jgi:hypothetical protein